MIRCTHWKIVQISSFFYNTFALTLYFQVQFIKVDCTANAKNDIKYELKQKPLPASREKDLFAKKIKYHGNPEKKRQTVKKRYHNKNLSIRQYSKEKYLKSRTSKTIYMIAKYQENPEVQLAYVKCKYLEIAQMKKR